MHPQLVTEIHITTPCEAIAVIQCNTWHTCTEGIFIAIEADTVLEIIIKHSVIINILLEPTFTI